MNLLNEPFIKYEWIVNDAAYFVVYLPDNERKVFDTRGEAEKFIENWKFARDWEPKE